MQVDLRKIAVFLPGRRWWLPKLFFVSSGEMFQAVKSGRKGDRGNQLN